MKIFLKPMIGALVVASATAIAGSTYADVVCSTADNVCWHVHHHYDYKPAFGVVVHPDNWTWGTSDHYVWKEHTGRGYWRSGVWVTF